MILFGSYASGRCDLLTDLDLLVEIDSSIFPHATQMVFPMVSLILCTNGGPAKALLRWQMLLWLTLHVSCYMSADPESLIAD